MVSAWKGRSMKKLTCSKELTPSPRMILKAMRPLAFSTCLPGEPACNAVEVEALDHQFLNANLRCGVARAGL